MPSGTEPLLLTREPQGVDQIVEGAVQHLGEVVDRVVDAVVGDAVLGKVVGANLGRTVPRAHLRPALSVVLTLWPPGPCERKTSIRRSLSSIFTSTSSASGSTATVAAEVWMRPCASVTGTRCTRWTPDSYRSVP